MSIVKSESLKVKKKRFNHWFSALSVVFETRTLTTSSGVTTLVLVPEQLGGVHPEGVGQSHQRIRVKLLVVLFALLYEVYRARRDGGKLKLHAVCVDNQYRRLSSS
jgi:hypothetical protein